MRTLDIAVVGYGTAGQAAALLLSRQGHRVRVFEQAPELAPVGAGVLIQPTGLSVLWRAGLLDAAMACGGRIERLHGVNEHGRDVMDMRYRQLSPELFGLGMQRGALFELLRDALSDPGGITTGVRMVGIDEQGRSLRDQDGVSHGPFDLCVIADGSASALRARIGGVRLDAVYPWGALWCLCPQREWPLAQVLAQRYQRARRMIGVLPVGHRPGQTRREDCISFFWSLRRADFEAWHSDGIDAWRACVAQLWPEAAELLQGVQQPEHLSRAVYRDAVLSRWVRGRAILIGDAAHSMSPQLGQGVNMALMDAQALADALAQHDNVDVALASCERERRRHVAIYQFWSRWLTPVFQSDRDWIAGLRDLAFKPLGSMWPGRGQMLRVLTGVQQGWFGSLGLPEGLLQAMAQANPES